MEKNTEVKLYVALAISIILCFILGFHTGKAIGTEKKPQSSFVTINGNRYYRDSVVEFSRHIDINKKEYTFVVVESVIGKICFEYFPEEGVNLDEWELSFLMCFEE